MLKKKNCMKFVLSFVFAVVLCCASFLGFGLMQTDNAHAIDLGEGQGETWTYTRTGSNGTLTLKGINYEDAIRLDANTLIEFQGDNRIAGDGECAIYLQGYNFSFSGSGASSLIIGDDSFAIFEPTVSDINIGNLTCNAWMSGTEDTFTGVIPSSSAISITKLKLISVADETPEHTHSFTFNGEGAVLKATCGNTGCDLNASDLTATLNISNITAGQTPNPSIELGASWTATGKTLDLNENTLKYYSAVAEGSTDRVNETPLSDAPSVAGHYVAVATFELEPGNSVSIEKAFSITSLSATVTPKHESLTIEYGELTNGMVVPEDMFTYEKCEGLTKKFYLVKDSGDLEITGDSYYVSIGTYTFKVVILTEGGVTVAESSTTLIVEKTTPVMTVTFVKWEYGDTDPIPLVEGNVSEALLEYTFFYDAEHLQPVGGIPTEIRTYYVLVEFAGNDTMKAGSTTTTCTIKKRATSINWPNVTVVYNGTVQTVNATFKNEKKEDVALVVTFDSEFKNAGTYTATASLPVALTEFYELPNEVTRQYEIIPLEITVQIESLSTYYLASVRQLKAVCIGENQPVNGETPYTLHCEVTEGSDMGAYEITGNSTDPNYVITFIKGVYYVRNKILTLSLDSWVYGSPNEPSATAYYGEDKITYHYFKELSDEELPAKPTEPGRYRVEARILVAEEYYCTAYDGGVGFTINKIRVKEPKYDDTRYVYDGSVKTYSVEAQDFYKVEGASQVQAGTHKVKITLQDPAHYTWEEAYLPTLEYVFVIHKKTIQTPTPDNRAFKYTGNNLVYSVANSTNYFVEGNIQSKVGVHTVKISLTDAHNTCWENGSSMALEFDFVINQADITNPHTTNAKGEIVLTNPVIVVDSGESGIDPNTQLNVVEIDQGDKKQIRSASQALKTELKKYDSIFKIYDVSLKNGDVALQPNGTITLKITVPEELLNVNFRVYHIHTSENGEKTIELVDCSGASELGFITLQVDKLSDFVFVYEKSSLVPLIVTFACLLLVLSSLLALEIYIFLKQTGKIKTKANKAMFAVMPAMFVGSQIAWSIILGVLIAGVLAGNIIFLVFIIKNRKAKIEEKNEEDKESPSVAKDMSKTQDKKAKAKAKASKTENKKEKTKTSKTQKTNPDKGSSKEQKTLDLTKKK